MDQSFRVTGPLLDVLQVLVDAPTELHGWAIMKATARSGPTIYQVLERLSEAEWVSARWEAQHPEAGKPRRRFYRLIPTKLPAARALLAERRPQGKSILRLRPSLGGDM